MEKYKKKNKTLHSKARSDPGRGDSATWFLVKQNWNLIELIEEKKKQQLGFSIFEKNDENFIILDEISDGEWPSLRILNNEDDNNNKWTERMENWMQ